jgi:predicted permease
MLHVMGAHAGRTGPRLTRATAAKNCRKWVGYLIFAFVPLCLPVLIFFNVQYASQRQWTDVADDVAGWTVFILFIVIVPAGGAKWLRRVLKDRQSSKPVGR